MVFMNNISKQQFSPIHLIYFNKVNIIFVKLYLTSNQYSKFRSFSQTLHQNKI